MTDQAENQTDPSIGLNNIYLKDASFEAPNSPEIFNNASQPEFEVNMGIETESLEQDFYEVVLNITVTATIKDKTAFLVEVKQGGVFTLTGFDDDTMGQIIGIYCPTQLFPYAREAVASLIGRGGFPPLLLDPINFEQVYYDQMQAQGDVH